MNFRFITNVPPNIGDYFVQEGVRAILDRVAPGYQIIAGASASGVAPETADRRIPRVDAIVQCGAPICPNPDSEPQSTEEWIQSVWQERIGRPSPDAPVLNLSAGSRQACGDRVETPASDPRRAAFIRGMHNCCRITTVRDALARDTLAALDLPATLLPCASIHAWRRHAAPDLSPARVAMNYTPDAGDGDRWQQHFLEIVKLAERRGFETVFIAHDRSELDAMSVLLPGRPVLFSDNYADYFRYYGPCAGGILNRVDGAVLLAGRGSPAVTIGGDCSRYMLDELGLPRLRHSETNSDTVVAEFSALIDDNGSARRRLIALEQRSFRAHCDAVRRALGKSDAAAVMEARVTAVRRRLSPGTHATPPPRERWIDPQPLLSLEGADFIREAYLKLFGRSPEPEGLRHWSAILAAGTGKAQCLMALAGSEEARMQGVRLVDLSQSAEEFVRAITFGQIDSESLSRWVQLLESGKVSRHEAARLLARSVGPESILVHLAAMRQELDWHRRAIEWLLPE